MERQPRIAAKPIPVGRSFRSPQPTPILTPKDIYLILRRHVILIIVLTFLGLIAAGVSWYLLAKYAPKYTAKTYIQVLPPVQQDPMDIRSAIVNKDLQYGYRQSIAALISQQTSFEQLLARDKIRQTEWFKSFGTNVGSRFGPAFENLKDNLGVSALRDAEFVAVSMTCGNAEEAALIVNEMVGLFIGSQQDTKVREVRDRLVQLERRRNFVQGELDAAERALDEIRSRFGFTDLEERNFEHTVTLRVNTLDTEEQDLRLTVSQLQANIANLEELAQGPIGVQVENTIESDPIMVFLTQSIFARKNQLAALMIKFGENHRTVRELQELIDDLQERRNIRKGEIGEQTRQANLENAEDHLVVLKRRLEETENQRQLAQDQKGRLDQARVQYAQQIRVRDQLQDVLNEIKEHIEKLRIVAEDPETPKVRRVGLAPKPLKMSSPLWYVYFPGGTVLGFMFGIGLAFLIELLNDLLRTPRDVVAHLDVPLLGVIPHFSEDRRIEGVDLCHVARLAPYSIVSESYRRLRVNLELSGSENPAKVLLVSSCGAGDGKTTVAINLATTLVAEGKKVLLIDANFWRSMLHKEFPRSGLGDKSDEEAVSDRGLSNLLRGEWSAQDVIRSSGLEMFDIIDCGPTPANPNELLANPHMGAMIRQQRDQYDYIIIDGPPVLLVSGAKILAGYADGTILVFNADLTRRGTAQRAVREIRQINAGVVGCVLMGARALKGGYFHEQFRSYQAYQVAQPAT